MSRWMSTWERGGFSYEQDQNYQRLRAGLGFHETQDAWDADQIAHQWAPTIGQRVDHRSDRPSDRGLAHLRGGVIVECPFGATAGTGDGGRHPVTGHPVFCCACRDKLVHVQWASGEPDRTGWDTGRLVPAST